MTTLPSTKTWNSPYLPWIMSTSVRNSRRIFAATRTAWMLVTQYAQYRTATRAIIELLVLVEPPDVPVCAAPLP